MPCVLCRNVLGSEFSSWRREAFGNRVQVAAGHFSPALRGDAVGAPISARWRSILVRDGGPLPVRNSSILLPHHGGG